MAKLDASKKAAAEKAAAEKYITEILELVSVQTVSGDEK